MSQHIDAIFENGVLRPLEPLQLPDQTRVKVSIEGATATESSGKASAQPAEKPLAADAMGYPAGYFEATAGCFAGEPLERPSDLPWESREPW